jgi:hypothetical protein
MVRTTAEGRLSERAACVVYRSLSVSLCCSLLCACIYAVSGLLCEIFTCFQQYQYLQPTREASYHSCRRHSCFLVILMSRILCWMQSLLTKGEYQFFFVYAAFHLILLNTVAHTHLFVGSGTFFALDLVCCNLGRAVNLHCSAFPDLRGDYHLPVNLHVCAPFPSVSVHPDWCTLLHIFDNCEYAPQFYTSCHRSL